MDASRVISILLSFTAACLLSVILVLSLGCNQRPSTKLPKPLEGIAPELVARLGGLHFVQDVTTGYQLAEKQDLPCLLFFTADWCTYCHQMEETAFRDPIIKNLAEEFVCIKVDADRYPSLCQQLEVTGFPTIQFLAADGRTLHRLVGRQSAESLATGMRAASQRFAWLNGQVPVIH